MSDTQALGEMIRRRRKQLSLNQTEFCGLVGLKYPNHLSLIENGKQCSLDLQIRILRKANVKVFLTVEFPDTDENNS